MTLILTALGGGRKAGKAGACHASAPATAAQSPSCVPPPGPEARGWEKHLEQVPGCSQEREVRPSLIHETGTLPRTPTPVQDVPTAQRTSQASGSNNWLIA